MELVVRVSLSDKTRALLEGIRAEGVSLDQDLREALSLLTYVLGEIRTGAVFGYLSESQKFIPTPIRLDISSILNRSKPGMTLRFKIGLKHAFNLWRRAHSLGLSLTRYLEAALDLYYAFHDHYSLNQPFVLKKGGKTHTLDFSS